MDRFPGDRKFNSRPQKFHGLSSPRNRQGSPPVVTAQAAPAPIKPPLNNGGSPRPYNKGKNYCRAPQYPQENRHFSWRENGFRCSLNAGKNAFFGPAAMKHRKSKKDYCRILRKRSTTIVDRSVAHISNPGRSHDDAFFLASADSRSSRLFLNASFRSAS